MLPCILCLSLYIPDHTWTTVQDTQWSVLARSFLHNSSSKTALQVAGLNGPSLVKVVVFNASILLNGSQGFRHGLAIFEKE